MSNKIRFGPSGNSNRFYDEGLKHTYQAAEWVAKMGLDAYEYSFGRGVKMGLETATKIADAFRQQGIAISAHAPYFVNYGNPDLEKISNSHNYILQSVQAIQSMGGNRVVVHSGVQGKENDRQAVVTRIANHIKDLIKILDDNTDGNYIVCPETMGKYSQIGSYQEVFSLCLADDRVVPCIDFGHINCVLQGELKTVDDFMQILNCGISMLGREKMQSVHVHFNKIQYSKAGEIRHLTFADTQYGPEYEPFVQSIIELKLTPVVICESDGTQADDILEMKKYYESI
ncbi:MAG: TIM barrel protein [Firmicutes bacterium]|nr:TIM barrel protein [Bacillota bacterium]MCL1954212.1 TIM barrel protein [Bacillota bacterium]